jgi:ectoine hydroxylase-related dioxygenase (phytanoyl-CoA dioxygenase family)
MGPTVFIPDTISEDHHRSINNKDLADQMLQNIPSSISTLGTGDCSLYNPMMLHAGGGNESNRRRRLFYFTFMSAGVKDPSNDFNPGSINPILKQRNLSLEEVQESLKAHCQVV